MIETTNLKFSYGSDQEFQFPDISCTENQTVLITGNSGNGKTTLLHLLGGLLKPHSGQILINSQNINDLAGSKLDAFRGSNIGMILQKSYFVEALSVLDNVVLASWIAKKRKSPTESVKHFR